MRFAPEMHAAALPAGTEQLAYGGFQALMCVDDHQMYAPQAAPSERPKEAGPERLDPGWHDGDPEDLTPPVRVDCDGHYHRH
jgi:hypothetical protein